MMQQQNQIKKVRKPT